MMGRRSKEMRTVPNVSLVSKANEETDGMSSE